MNFSKDARFDPAFDHSVENVGAVHICQYKAIVAVVVVLARIDSDETSIVDIRPPLHPESMERIVPGEFRMEMSFRDQQFVSDGHA